MLFGLIQGLPSYYASSIIMLVGVELCGSIPLVVMLSHWFARRRAFAIAIFLAIPAVLSTPMGPLIAWGADLETFWPGWRITAFILAGIVAVIARIAFSKMRNAPNDMDLLPDGVPAPAQQAPTVSFTMREVFRSRPFWFLTIGEGLAVASLSAGHSIAGWKALELVDSTLLAIMLAIATFVSVCFYLVGGLAGDRFPKYKVLASFAALQALGILVLVFAGNMPIISLALAVMSIGAGGLVPLALAIVPDYYGTGSLGIILGIQVVLVSLVSTVAPASPLAGWILDVTGSYFLTLLPPLVLTLLAAFLFLKALPPRAPETNVPPVLPDQPTDY